jgi:hypothetical protein
MNYICPVCGYDRLSKPPADHNICPCCGTEFGYADIAHTFEQLRERWITRGATWFSAHTPPPPDWNAGQQLACISHSIYSFTYIGQNVRVSSEYSEASVKIMNLPMAMVHERLEREVSGTNISSTDATG